MKVLLLNPPSREFVIRDYFCSHTSKANYYWAPIDLLVLNGILRDNNLFVMDCIVTKTDKTSCLKRIVKIKPDIVISLVSAITEKEDMEFLKLTKAKTKSKIFIIGDSAYFETEKTMKKYKFIEGIIIDFTSDNIAKYLNGEHFDNTSLVYIKNSNIVYPLIKPNREFEYGIPRHELFPIKRYSLPYSHYKKTTTVLASNYGCPFNCKFCNSGKLGFRERKIENFINELKYVKKLGIKEVYFRDFSFTVNQKKTKKICKEIIKNQIKIKWSCDARVDNVSKKLLYLMKKAGCYLIFFGIESSENELLKITNKNITAQKIEDTLKYCRKIGLSTLGSFIIGLPNDTYGSIQNTISFSKKISLDYASFNLFVPRLGSDYRNELEKQKRIKNMSLDSSKNVYSVCDIEEKILIKYQKYAIRSFYFRPSYILRRLLSIKTPYQLFNIIKNGFSLVKK